MEPQLITEGTTLFQIISYVITVVIGGVGYKYLQLWIGHKENSVDSERTGNQLLITNLQERLNQITEQLNSLELERKEYHERELKRVKEVENAKSEVNILRERLKYIEDSMDALKIVIKAYEKHYGPLNEKN